MREAVIFLTDGTEECEALIVVDVLRRAGIDITTVSLKKDKTILSLHNVPVGCDESISEFKAGSETFMIVPGGLAGTNRMKEDQKLKEVLKAHLDKGGKLAAICAGPTVLAHFGLIDGKTAVCFPGCEGDLGDKVTYDKDSYVRQDDWLITGRGVGATFDFALAIVAELRDRKTADELAGKLQYRLH